MVQTWLWIGVSGMAIGSLVFGLGAARAQNERWQILYTLNFFICLIAAGLYLAMAMGQGQSIVYDRPTFWIRFVTWSLSTPLLLLDLAFLARSRVIITASLIGANAYMLFSGFAATMSPQPISYVWYIVSCAAFVATLYLLLHPYRIEAERQYPRSKRVFRKLLTVHVVVWSLYPIVWILASTGFNVLSQGGEAAGYAILDLASKVGFGFLALDSLRQLEQTKGVEPVGAYRSSTVR